MRMFFELVNRVLDIDVRNLPTEIEPIQKYNIEKWILSEKPTEEKFSHNFDIQVEGNSGYKLFVNFCNPPQKDLLEKIESLTSYLSQKIESVLLEDKFHDESEFWLSSFKNCPNPMVIESSIGKLSNDSALRNAKNPFVQWQEIEAESVGVNIGQDLKKIFGLKNELFEQEKFVEMALLASSIAHEINNPLSVMRNYLYFLEIDQKVSPEIALKIKDEIKKLEKLTEQLLRTVKGQDILKYEWINLAKFFEDFRVEINKKFLDLNISIDQGFVKNLWLFTDRKIFQELMNGLVAISVDESTNKEKNFLIVLVPGNREHYVEFGIVTEIPWKDIYDSERTYENLLKTWSFRSQLTWPHIDELSEKLQAIILAKKYNDRLMLQVSMIRDDWT